MTTDARMPNFESFSRDLLPLRSKPHVTIQRRGSLSLNKSAYEALGKPSAVELLFDKVASIVGMRAVATNASNSYYVRHSARSGGGPWLVSAMAFLKYYDIDATATRRWPAYLEGAVLCVDLNGTPLS